MNVVVIEVGIDASRQDEVTQVLNEFVVPSTVASPGFVKGLWMQRADMSCGQSVLWFDDEANAKAMIDAVNASPPPGDSPVVVRSAELYTVRAEA